MKIEVFRGDHVVFNQQWYWHFVARNGRIVADSEGYTTRHDAIRAAKAFVRAVVKPILNSLKPISVTPIFRMEVSKDNITTIRWL